MRLLLPVLLVLIVFLLLRSIVRGFLQSSSDRQRFEPHSTDPKGGDRNVKMGKMEKDPVCGTYVDVATSIHAPFGGEVLYFCSEECLKKYKKSR